MATPVWPVSLPQALPIEAPEKPSDGRRRFTNEAGPQKLWAISTADPIVIEVPRLHITTDQRDTLDTFFGTTLSRGVAKFEWTDPWPGAGTLTFRFMDRPAYVAVTPSMPRQGYATDQILYRVSFSLEWLPWFPPEA